MKIVRFVLNEDAESSISYGIAVEENRQIRILPVSGDPFFSVIEPIGTYFDLSEVRLLSPVIPRSKIVGVDNNYFDNSLDSVDKLILFLKANTTVIGPNDPINLPDFSNNFMHNGQLAIVIKRICKDIPPNRVAEVIFGYTIANDVTAFSGGDVDTYFRSKNFDSSCPLGPWIDTDFSLEEAKIVTSINGVVQQEFFAKDMTIEVANLISYISKNFTLLPGDVVLLGSAKSDKSFNMEGHRVEIEIEKLGTLSNTVLLGKTN